MEAFEKVMKFSEKYGEKAEMFKMEPKVKKQKKEPIKMYEK